MLQHQAGEHLCGHKPGQHASQDQNQGPDKDLEEGHHTIKAAVHIAEALVPFLAKGVNLPLGRFSKVDDLLLEGFLPGSKFGQRLNDFLVRDAGCSSTPKQRTGKRRPPTSRAAPKLLGIRVIFL